MSEVLTEIQKSNTSEEIKKETIHQYKMASDILKTYKEAYGENSDSYKKIKKEYDDIENSIKSSLLGDMQISIEERRKIGEEFSDFKNKSSQSENSILRYIRNKMDDRGIMAQLGVTSLDGNGFGNGFLHGYNNVKGNYVVKIEEFEKSLKGADVYSINSKALGNYFLYLKSIGKLDTANLIKIFGERTLFELNELWKKGNDKDGLIAKRYLETNGGKELFKILGAFDSIDKFLLESNKIDDEKLILSFLNENIDYLKNKFKKEIKDKFIANNPGREKEAESISNEMVEKLVNARGVNKLKEIYGIFAFYNEKYRLGLNIQNKTSDIFKIQEKIYNKLKYENQIAQKNAKGDKNVLRKLNKDEEAINKEISYTFKADLINKKLDEKTIEKINSGELVYEKVVEKLIKEDSELKKKLEEIDKKFLPNEEQKNNQAENTNPENKDTLKRHDGSDINVSKSGNGDYSLQLQNGGFINVNYNEFQLVKNNSEALENIINFKELLEKLGLGLLWKYRENIFQGLRNKYTFSFDLNNNYLSGNDVKKFLVSVLKSIGIKNFDFNSKIEDIIRYITELKNIGEGFTGNYPIEDRFIKTYIGKDGSFLQTKFENSLTNIN